MARFVPDVAFSFHPFKLGEAALAGLFSDVFEGLSSPDLIEAESILLARLTRTGSRWRVWR